MTSGQFTVFKAVKYKRSEENTESKNMNGCIKSCIEFMLQIHFVLYCLNHSRLLILALLHWHRVLVHSFIRCCRG